ncbi:hypothetical protein ACGFR6_27475 [Streptomyces sp. NPDC048567]|uniref:hypothetical protein n=1 Tax=Streptomyces sp. NPDC048567 TaxID=3365570 RepID=UPI00371B47D4
MPNSAAQYDSHLECPRGQPDAGGVRVADPGGEDCRGAPDVVHRLAQPGRYLLGAGVAQRRPRRFGAVFLVLVLLVHDSIVLRDGGHHSACGSKAASPLPHRLTAS